MLEGQAELDGESEENRDGQRKQIWSGKTKMVRENEDNQGEQRLSRKTKIAWKTKMVRENKDGQGEWSEEKPRWSAKAETVQKKEPETKI